MMRVAVWKDGTEWEVPGVLFEAPSESAAVNSGSSHQQQEISTSGSSAAVNSGKRDAASDVSKTATAKKRAGKVARLKAKHPKAVDAIAAVRKKAKGGGCRCRASFGAVVEATARWSFMR